MTSPKQDSKTARAARRAEALKDNLRKRKEQQRARDIPPATTKEK